MMPARQLCLQEYVVIHDKSIYVQGVAGAVCKTMNDNGLKVIFYEDLNAGEKAY